MTLHGTQMIRGPLVPVPGADYPWPGGPPRAFEECEVTHFGKLAWVGTARIAYLCRLTDGTEVMVKGAAQEPDAAQWLRRLSARCGGAPCPSRDAGWGIKWMEALR